MSFWVYMLHCSDGHYYSGHTDNLEKRIAEHSMGTIPGCYTFNRRPLSVVFSQEFPTREEALTSEQQIKGWSRKKKEALICGDWAEISRLARSSIDAARTTSVCDEPASSVRHEPPSPVHPELVEG